ncbi:MAG: hypothetical protein QM644_06905 [Mobilitalea sp.]
MKLKTIVILMTVIAFLEGLIFNFIQFVNDYQPITMKNVAATAVFVILWCIALMISIKNQYFGFLKFSLGYWIITLLLAGVIIYVNLTDAIVDWAIIPAVLVLTQWHGMSYYIENYLDIGIVIAGVSAVLVSITVTSLLMKKYKPIS